MKNKIEFFVATVLLFAVYFGIIPYKLNQLNEALNLPNFNNSFLEIIGFIFIILGITTYLLTAKTFFKVAGNTPLIIHPTRSVMKTSLYKRTRNPMYIGHLILIFGEFLIYGSILIFFFWIFTVVFLHCLVVFYEEPLTKKRLGRSYEEYLGKVPRWI